MYKTEERSKIELENQELKHKLGEEYNNSRIQIQKKLEELQEKSNLKIAEDLRLQQEIELELEEYVIGVVAAEMPASFNIEALKAQKNKLVEIYLQINSVYSKKLAIGEIKS